MATAVTIAPTPILAFLNNQGQPCVGGTLLTQVGGVNTATYQDSAGTIPLPNPIPLNNRGEISNAAGISCQLFLATGVAYTFTLFDANGNLLNQAIYVATSNAFQTFINSLLSSIGATLIGWIQAGTGAVYRLVQDKLRDTVSVKDFGAIGDGVANDTAAIQAAINYNLNGTVFFPAGSYNITATLTVNYDVGTGKNSCNLVGTGLGSTLQWNGASNTQMFWIQGTSINAGTFSKTLITGLYLKNPVAATGLIGFRIGNFAGPFTRGAGVGNVTIKGNKLDNFAVCIQTEYESDGIEISDNTFGTYTLYGVYNTGSARMRISGNYFQFGTAGSLAIQCQYSTITIEDNLIQSSATGVVGAIKLLNCNGFRIEANYMEFAQTGAQFAILLSNSRDGYIGSNPIQGFQGADCIYIDATSGNVDIGPNNYGFFAAAPNSLIRTIAGSTNVNILGTQAFVNGAPPAVPFLGTGFNFALDAGTLVLGVPAYTATPNSGVTAAASGVVNIGNNAGAGGWAFQSYCRSGVVIGSINQSGTTGILYNTTSDYRLKNISGPLTTARDFVMALKPKVGTWVSDGSPFVGFLAHEFQAVSPASVTGARDAVDEDGKPIYQTLSASSPETIANMVAFMQELQSRLAALESK